MKKGDFLVFGTILISLIILVIVYLPKKTKLNEGKVIISVLNQDVAEFLLANEDETVEYLIIATPSSNILVYQQNQLILTLENYRKNDIYNKIIISNQEIKMSEANCLGHDCLKMVINDHWTLPIICTNGIVIRIEGLKKTDILV